jgi:Fe(3+) dicitrate transport protein
MDLAPGKYHIQAHAQGMGILTREVEVKDRDVSLDFMMQVLFQELEEVTVKDERVATFGISRLNSVEGTAIYEAKKSEVIVMEDITANLATNNSRQVYSRVAGLNIWESDGAGVQLGIGGRGLSPNRSSNFNTRQNGYDIAADALGYPESYYTPPTQAINKIEIVRGAASLQYGTQFGGMVNFRFKEGPDDRPFAFSTRQTGGSFGLFNSFNSVGGTTGKVNYYGFYNYKRNLGWRPNSDLNQHTAYGSVRFDLSDRFSITTEYTYMSYLAQQPGGLTDQQFDDDPRQSNRERNWFSVNWNLAALLMDYRLAANTRLNTRFFGLYAGRDALDNLGRIDRPDFGGERDLIRDDFRNWGNETRLMHHYHLGENRSVLLTGIRYYHGFTHRRQGLGSDRSDADFDFLNPDDLEGSDFDLPSRNVSWFAENIFNLTNKFSLTPGVRFESIRTETDGYYKNRVEDLAGNILVDEKSKSKRIPAGF